MGTPALPGRMLTGMLHRSRLLEMERFHEKVQVNFLDSFKKGAAIEFSICRRGGALFQLPV